MISCSALVLSITWSILDAGEVSIFAVSLGEDLTSENSIRFEIILFEFIYDIFKFLSK